LTLKQDEAPQPKQEIIITPEKSPGPDGSPISIASAAETKEEVEEVIVVGGEKLPKLPSVAQKIAAIEKKKNEEAKIAAKKSVDFTPETVVETAIKPTASSMETNSPLRVQVPPSDLFSPGGTRKIDPEERNQLRVKFCGEMIDRIDGSKGISLSML
jgi:hypothetical protein